MDLAAAAADVGGVRRGAAWEEWEAACGDARWEEWGVRAGVRACVGCGGFFSFWNGGLSDAWISGGLMRGL